MWNKASPTAIAVQDLHWWRARLPGGRSREGPSKALTFPVFGGENTLTHATPEFRKIAAKICYATREQIEYYDIKSALVRCARIEFSRVRRTQPQWQNVTKLRRKAWRTSEFQGVNPLSL